MRGDQILQDCGDDRDRLFPLISAVVIAILGRLVKFLLMEYTEIVRIRSLRLELSRKNLV